MIQHLEVNTFTVPDAAPVTWFVTPMILEMLILMIDRATQKFRVADAAALSQMYSPEPGMYQGDPLKWGVPVIVLEAEIGGQLRGTLADGKHRFARCVREGMATTSVYLVPSTRERQFRLTEAEQALLLSGQTEEAVSRFEPLIRHHAGALRERGYERAPWLTFPLPDVPTRPPALPPLQAEESAYSCLPLHSKPHLAAQNALGRSAR